MHRCIPSSTILNNRTCRCQIRCVCLLSLISRYNSHYINFLIFKSVYIVQYAINPNVEMMALQPAMNAVVSYQVQTQPTHQMTMRTGSSMVPQAQQRMDYTPILPQYQEAAIPPFPQMVHEPAPQQFPLHSFGHSSGRSTNIPSPLQSVRSSFGDSGVIQNIQIATNHCRYQRGNWTVDGASSNIQQNNAFRVPAGNAATSTNVLSSGV